MKHFLAGCTLLFAATLTAQTGEQSTDKPGGADAAAHGKTATTEPARGYRDGSKYFMTLMSMRPRRVAPGQSSTLYVTVVFRGKAVVLPGSLATVRLDADKLPFKLAAPTVQPPATGTLPGHFLGKPVYEESLIFAVPLAANGDAPHKRHLLRGRVALALHDASTGKSIGEFGAPVAGEVSIGTPIPVSTDKPRQNKPARAPETANTAPDPTGRVAATGGATTPSPGSTRSGSLETRPPQGTANPDASKPTTPRRDNSTTAWSVGIGTGIAGLIVFLLLTRRRA